MLGFKRFDHAAITISGIELAEQIKKGQFKTGKFREIESDYVGTLERGGCRLTPCADPQFGKAQPTSLLRASLHQSLISQVAVRSQ
jgi:hypothetical protein